jgi:hypothetical protein
MQIRGIGQRLQSRSAPSTFRPDDKSNCVIPARSSRRDGNAGGLSHASVGIGKMAGMFRAAATILLTGAIARVPRLPEFRG